MGWILKMNIKFSYFYANKLNKKSFQIIIEKFQNDNNLSTYLLNTDSNFYWEKINNIDKLFNKNFYFKSLKLNFFDPDEITFVSETLIYNNSLEKIN